MQPSSWSSWVVNSNRYSRWNARVSWSATNWDWKAWFAWGSGWIIGSVGLVGVKPLLLNGHCLSPPYLSALKSKSWSQLYSFRNNWDQVRNSIVTYPFWSFSRRIFDEISVRSSNVESWYGSLARIKQHREKSSGLRMTAAWHVYFPVIVAASEEKSPVILYRIDKGTTSALFVFEITVFTCFRYLRTIPLHPQSHPCLYTKEAPRYLTGYDHLLSCRQILNSACG
jgi:hypothetical protein